MSKYTALMLLVLLNTALILMIVLFPVERDPKPGVIFLKKVDAREDYLARPTSTP
jgi:hypothetical protein